MFFSVLPFIAAIIRFEGTTWPLGYATTILVYVLLSVPLKLEICYRFGLYRRLWPQASLPDMLTILQAGLACAVLGAVLGITVLPLTALTPLRVPISVAILDGFFTLTAIAASRMFLRIAATWRLRRRTDGYRRVLIAGAGAAGQMILREMLNNPRLALVPVGFVDDDSTKHHQRLGGVPILGSLRDIPSVVKEWRIEEVVIAMPTAAGSVVRQVVRSARDSRVPARTVPALYDILAGRVSLSNLRKVEIQDLLRREPVRTDLEPVRNLVQQRTVLITGAGGSIGSELARQVACLDPAELILLGNAENEIFDILNELQDAHPTAVLTPVIADVRNKVRLSSVFKKHRPQVVLHAAAHKHVPLMEENVVDAVTNNVLGTANAVDAALESHAQHFVLISTDKAVRPTSIMGTTKRVAEMVVQRTARVCHRNFVSVRFGNVLGSRGSVVPTFLRQIQAGGPVTVTHPEMTRYFMTIPEAVQLVLHAAVLGSGSEVFVLDMGEPVRIVDLATDMIRLSGLEVGKDIEIRYTGIRPGERLYEERYFDPNDVTPTAHPKVMCANDDLVPPNFDALFDHLLMAAHECRPDDELRRLLKALVPEFAGARADFPLTMRRPSTWHTRPRPLVVERRSGVDRRVTSRRAGGAIASLRDLDRRAKGDRRSGLDRRVEAATPASTTTEPMRSQGGVA